MGTAIILSPFEFPVYFLISAMNLKYCDYITGTWHFYDF